MKYKSHYDFIDAHFEAFAKANGVTGDIGDIGSAHGDKAEQYKERWNRHGIHYFHGVFLYLLARLAPFSKEVRDTPNGWVSPDAWVIDNYARFKSTLPKIG